jgi:CelD/BcsL family acetyltransferase involved in cellulose biosynthesis
MQPPTNAQYPSVDITVVETVQDFYNLTDVWNTLAESFASYLPWINHEWFTLYLKHFFKDQELLILLLRQEGGTAAIAPFAIKKEKIKRTITTRKIELIGNFHSPIRIFIQDYSSQENAKDLISKIFSFFLTQYRQWDVLQLPSLPEENDLFNTFHLATRNIPLQHRTYLSAQNRYLDNIYYPFKEYFQNLPKKVKKDINYCERRLNKSGNLEFRLKRDAENLDNYLDLYEDLRVHSWTAPEIDRSFNREFARLMVKMGWLRLGVLYYDAIPIAAQKWIVCNNTAYIHDVLYHQDYKKYSPGKILLSKVSEYVIEKDGVNQIDFMTGDESYKKEWTPKLRERKGIQLFNRTFMGHTYALLTMRLFPILKKYPRLASLTDKFLSRPRTSDTS